MAIEKLSPGMQQYVDIKKQYPDAFLLFRMGDFYELFYEDAVNAAQILEISLTSRNKNADNPIPMAGVPYHSAQQYIDVLIEQGYKVAIAEQMEDPKQAVGVVKREVVQVITPGTVVDSSKPDSQNNFLVSIDREGNQFGLAYMDLVTGDFYVTGLLDFTLVCGEIRNLKAREVVLGYDLSEEEEQILSRQMNLVLSYEKESFEDLHLLDLRLATVEQTASSKLLQYVHRTQMRELNHLKPVIRYEIKDLLQLATTLSSVPRIRAILEGMEQPTLAHLIAQLDAIPELESLISAAIAPEAPHVITDGGIIRTGFDETLDKYRCVLREGTSWIAEIEAKERENSGISTLKIDYNKKDGYYFHVTNSQLGNVPAHFFRKATLKNSERFGTEELARIEGDMLEAREKSANLEYEIFMRIREEVGKYIQRLQALAQGIATVDVLQSLAVVAETQHLIRPEFGDDSQIDIRKGRHAVVEKVMGAQTYIPNTIQMAEDTSIQLVTGPNMSGKSTYMRQLAMTAVMAQLGSYVPAESAHLPIFDAIFTRIGAADDLVSGQSTFMVEMMEANNAISHATKNSLILFDELGRGTATYDGMALAQSIIEYIHEHIGAKTLFATHYHELTSLESSLQHLVNVHVATLEQDGQVTFLHKIEPGPADKSYGIHVAKIAGLPADLLARADKILTQLENQGTESPPPMRQTSAVTEQISLFDRAEEHPILAELAKLDVYNMTPMQVMNVLVELKQKL
ncbi:DNA mismatch repair protein MutS [Streptococcus pneumoniae]|uniref:DNA mismatch repair protein MutS n=1 Tax=Streptococcus pneumoniae TaxID=1313 RepID=UPI00061C8FFC|nr:DNA mismatch repair protein MutS [Streptococcus pneumoniae]CGF41845.1 DNA mismatch repair protein MutS [Streptococcus pneumoniae]